LSDFQTFLRHFSERCPTQIFGAAHVWTAAAESKEGWAERRMTALGAGRAAVHASRLNAAPRGAGICLLCVVLSRELFGKTSRLALAMRSDDAATTAARPPKTFPL